MSKQQEEGLRWHPVYVSETAHAVRYVLAEDAMDAGAGSGSSTTPVARLAKASTRSSSSPIQ